jgi:hypothetical protein
MTATAREDFFTLIHNGQRRQLFAFTTSAGPIPRPRPPQRSPPRGHDEELQCQGAAHDGISPLGPRPQALGPVPPHRSRRRQLALDVAPAGDHEPVQLSTVQLGQVLMNRAHHDRSFSYCARYALDGPVAHVAHGEHAWQAGLERQWRAL